MARTKGTVKTGGRTKGTPNNISENIRQSLLTLLSDNMEQLKIDIKGMELKDRANTLISLAKHCTAPAMNPEKLTTEQLEQIIKYFKDNEAES